MRALVLSLLAAISLASISDAQTPAPVVVPATTPAAISKGPSAPDNTSGSTQDALKALQALKAANEELLKQQAATLLKLDEVEKAANEIRIYTKRS